MKHSLKRMAERLWGLLTGPVMARRAAKEARRAAADARRALLEELADCRSRLRSTESLFSETSEPGMVESCIYQYRALQARYDSLVRQIRLQDAAGAAPYEPKPAEAPQSSSAGYAVRIPL